MKRSILLAFAALTLFSCSKSSSTNEEPKPEEPTVLLTKIINNTTGDTYYGKPIMEFTYNGKQLTKSTIYHYSITPDVETNIFVYDGRGILTGTTISHTRSNTYDYAKSTVTLSGSNVGNIKFYKSGNVLGAEHTLTYSNGNLTKWFNPNEVEINYQYDANGNNTKQDATEYSNGNATNYKYTITNKSFDDKKNLTNALPYWIYFRAYLQEHGLSYTPGAHNPVSFNDDGSEKVYSYTYNSYGYPASMTISGSGDTESYTYEYTEVN
ncbi:hypothetical protein EOD41_04705 [Mucilaginibacter limnophilus]|uniref:DUF4595 domain-containing protein n=1 Tax=Mucilaginibacter limnophilus TaxID=1932778 RepID=A0A3S2ULL6_9SPHI|nr:hypothetical protein [Mucilaginibacter limnophilus]RVU01271.1 hypothetical protein EOD41_04705 [Mucilaginibacter limnophilus]